MSDRWILVTGNGAFGDTAERSELRYDVNPSALVAQRLDGRVVEGRRVVGRALDWDDSPLEALEPLLSGEDGTGGAGPPEAIVSCGVFSERTTLRLERVAVNVRDFQFADGDRRPIDEPVVEGGPAAYLSTLPIKAAVQAVRAAGVPAVVSNSASTHGCNSVMYCALHLVATRGLPTRAGFVHLPDPPEHVARLGRPTASMCLDDQVRGVEAVIGAVVLNPVDVRLPSNEWEW
ncbi:pyroglutamyl-peptidase I family protein [Conexibacter woesei]|uniref:Pyrrolidone-carboxylate peptidase n=1 Tax=Conexibacter woesei (strain DSM 14684 / CCUG 47730 / CIP 108061 / JCM 11494 / NBRC 100937 / ID131577) TaxID=469383 RepID=D3F1S5_CONWI|nr:pyroglutamyl-peptidase I [Conexibacter woesei]ADB54106.1 Pyroglutamyl-peptidase I [Conexibacter woesei DSM 14684]